MSTLTAAYDPGQFLKYLGSVMICLGTFLMFYVKVPLLKDGFPMDLSPPRGRRPRFGGVGRFAAG